MILIAVLLVTMVACRTEGDGSAIPAGERSWVPLPEEVPMPGSAPDDPAAYRGVRYQMASGTPYAVVQSPRPSGVGQPVQGAPWLRGYPANGSPGEGADGPWFGYQLMRDDRRLMVWFYRLVDPPGSDAAPNRRAILDVVAISGDHGTGCGPDSMILDGDKTWRLNRTTGRIEPVDRDDAECDD